MPDEAKPRNINPRFVIGTGLGDGYTQFCCPICREEYVHHGGVMVEQGGFATHIGNQTAATQCVTPDGSRGSTVAVRFNCESGHEFEYHWWFHKGMMFLRLIETAKSVEYKRNREEQPHYSELWRD